MGIIDEEIKVNPAIAGVLVGIATVGEAEPCLMTLLAFAGPAFP
jgi:hypothetical protein